LIESTEQTTRIKAKVYERLLEGGLWMLLVSIFTLTWIGFKAWFKING